LRQHNRVLKIANRGIASAREGDGARVFERERSCAPFGCAGARRFLGWAGGKIANLIPIERDNDVIGDVHCATLILAVGMAFVMIGGGIDLSMPANMALAAVLGALYMGVGGSPFVGATIMIAAAISIGLLNGLAVALIEFVTHIVTPVTTVSMASFYGRWLYAVGINREAARVARVPIQRVICASYGFARRTIQGRTSTRSRANPPKQRPSRRARCASAPSTPLAFEAPLGAGPGRVSGRALRRGGLAFPPGGATEPALQLAPGQFGRFACARRTRPHHQKRTYHPSLEAAFLGLKRSMPSQGTVYASRIRLMRSILGLPRRINV